MTVAESVKSAVGLADTPGTFSMPLAPALKSKINIMSLLTEPSIDVSF